MNEISKAQIIGEIVKQVSMVINKSLDLSIKREDNRHAERMYELETERNLKSAEAEKAKAETEEIRHRIGHNA